MVVGGILVFSPQTLIDNVSLGVAPEWKDFLVAIPVAMIAYTGIETISNMAEEAKDEDTTIPAAIKRVVIAVFAIYAALPAVALSALPVYQDPATGDYVTKLGLTEEQGGFAGDPILGVVKQLNLGVFQGAGGAVRRHPRGDDPLHRHQRRASSASAGSCTRWGCTGRCRTVCASCTRGTARRGSGSSSSAASPA